MTDVAELAAMPSLGGLYARAGLGAIPGAGLLGRLPLVPVKPRRGELSGDRLRLAGVVADRDEVARYARVCAFTLRDELPVTYPHVISFPLQLALMASGSFPFPLLGLVHIADEITQHRPVAAGEPLDFEVGAIDLRPHPKGRAFTLAVRASADGEPVWEEAGTILQRGDGAVDGVREPEPADPPEDLVAGAEWRLPGDLGRRYAAVSGDRNPIHLHPLGARAFGFPRPIAHGMWSMARCLAQLEGRTSKAFTVAVSFRKPVLLPGRVRFATAAHEGRIAFALRGPGAEDPPLHLCGELRPL